jgi:hypothetical protein
MSVDQARRAWLRAVLVHARAADSHRVAAELFARYKDPSRAAVEIELAAEEGRRYAAQLARHPEWAGDAANVLDGLSVSGG